MLEWLKNRARARNWVEEVWLLEEEMGRALRFNESMASTWDVRAYPDLGDASNGSDAGHAPATREDVGGLDAGREQHRFAAWAKALRSTIGHRVKGDWDGDEAWADGVRAYAQKQAWIRRQQSKVWERQWSEARVAGQEFMKYHG